MGEFRNNIFSSLFTERKPEGNWFIPWAASFKRGDKHHTTQQLMLNIILFCQK